MNLEEQKYVVIIVYILVTSKYKVSLLSPVNIPNPFTILEGGSSNESVEPCSYGIEIRYLRLCNQL